MKNTGSPQEAARPQVRVHLASMKLANVLAQTWAEMLKYSGHLRGPDHPQGMGWGEGAPYGGGRVQERVPPSLLWMWRPGTKGLRGSTGILLPMEVMCMMTWSMVI